MATSTQEAKYVLSADDKSGAGVASALQRLHSLATAGETVGQRLKAAMGGDAVGRLSARLSTLRGQLGAVGIAGGAGLAIGGIAAIKTGIDATIAAAEKADRISDLGGRLRLNAEEFQVFEKIAKDSGASVEEVGSAYTKFRLNIAAAQNEGGKKLEQLARGLKIFGVSAKEASSMKPLELAKVLGKVSALSQQDKDELLKLEGFRDLFGKMGATTINFWEAVGTDYDATLKRMRASGTLITDEMAEQGGRAFKAYEKSKSAMAGLQLAFGIQMMPVFEKVSGALEARAKANREAMMPGVTALAEALTGAVDPFLDDLDKLAHKTSGIFTAIKKVADLVGWDTLIFGGLAVLSAPFVASAAAVSMSLLGISASAAKAIGSMVATQWAGAIKGIRAVTLSMALMGSTSAASWLMVLGPIALIVAAVVGVGMAVYALWTNLGNMFNYFISALTRIRDAFKQGFWSGIWQFVKEAFFATINTLIGFWNTFAEPIGKFFGKDWTIRLVGEGGEALRNIQALNAQKDQLESSRENLRKTIDPDDVRLAKRDVAVQSQRLALLNTAAPGAPGGEGAAASGLPKVPLATQRTEVGGKLDVRILADGQPRVERVESDNRNFQIDARSGMMFGAAGL